MKQTNQCWVTMDRHVAFIQKMKYFLKLELHMASSLQSDYTRCHSSYAACPFQSSPISITDYHYMITTQRDMLAARLADGNRAAHQKAAWHSESCWNIWLQAGRAPSGYSSMLHVTPGLGMTSGLWVYNNSRKQPQTFSQYRDHKPCMTRVLSRATTLALPHSRPSLDTPLTQEALINSIKCSSFVFKPCKIRAINSPLSCLIMARLVWSSTKVGWGGGGEMQTPGNTSPTIWHRVLRKDGTYSHGTGWPMPFNRGNCTPNYPAICVNNYPNIITSLVTAETGQPFVRDIPEPLIT